MIKRIGSGHRALAALLLLGCEGDVLIDVDPSFAVSRSDVTAEAPLGAGPVTEAVTIVNGTDGTLRGLAVEVQFPTGPSQWLGATLDQTTATREQPATLRLQANPDNLALGSYAALVLLHADGASNSPFRVTVHFTVQPRPPARVELLTAFAPQIANGAPIGVTNVRLVNALGEATPVAGVPVVATVTGGGTLSGSQVVQTDASGEASFSDLVLRGLAGPKSLVFGGTGLTPASGSFALVAGPAAQLVAVSALTQSAPAGANVPNPPVVSTQDDSGNPAGGVSVVFTPGAGGAVAPTGPVVSAADGTAALASWRLRNAAGENTLTASASGLAGSPISFTATGLPGAPVALAKVSGDNLVGIVSTTLGTPHVVRVTDTLGNGVPGATVTWTVTGGGSVAPASTVSDADGLAQATRTLGPSTGPVSTTATANFAGGPVGATFTVTAAATGPAQIVKVAGDGQTAPNGSTLPVPLSVRVLDAVGGPLADATVSWSTTDLAGSFPSGATSQTDATGVAAATWRLGTVAGTQTAQAAVGGPPPVMFTATAEAGAISPTQSTIVASPNLVTAGATASLVVTARDATGNGVSGAPVVLTLTGGGNLTQPTGPTNAAGVATGLFGGTSTGMKTVMATAGGVALSQAATITVNPGVPATLSAVVPTAFDVRFNQTVAPPPGVLVKDALGNPIPFAGVTYSRTSGASLLSGSAGPVLVAANASGVATLGSWFVQPIGSAVIAAVNVYNRLQAAASGTNAVTFVGTGDVRYSPDVSNLIATSCLSAGCHPSNGALSYSMLVTTAAPSTRFVASGDTLAITSTYNRLLAKIKLITSHGPNGAFAPNVVTLFAAWVKQGVKP